MLITGDIAEAPSLGDLLSDVASALRTPIYFVLGNHDFYRGSIPRVREAVVDLCRRSEWLAWLPAAGRGDARAGRRARGRRRLGRRAARGLRALSGDAQRLRAHRRARRPLRAAPASRACTSSATTRRRASRARSPRRSSATGA